MRIILLMLVGLFWETYVNAQGNDLKFEHYNDGDGLSHNAARHILQDKHGFLWIGTFSGLNRFDGYRFKQYLSTGVGNHSIKNDDITSLFI